MSASFHFQQLTPDLIHQALASVQLWPESGLLALNSYENRVYQFKADDGRRYVVKFYRPERWQPAQILEEHQLTHALQEAEIPVVAPLALTGNTLHSWQGFQFAVFPSIGGRSVTIESLDDYAQLGELTGRMHSVAKLDTFKHRPRLTIAADIAKASAQILGSAILPTKFAQSIHGALLEIEALSNTADQQIKQTIRLHGDCHSGNLLSTPELMWLDFDDSLQGPAVQDCWMLLQGTTNEQQWQLDAFLEEYQNFTDFNGSELALIEPLRSRRQVVYLAWLLQRWQDPAFPTAFPWVTTDEFWLQQIAQFRQQAACLQKPILHQLGGNY